MTVHGRYRGILADAAALDLAFNALPGVNTEDAFYRSNIPIWACTSDLAATSSGVAIGTRIFLRKGDPVGYITFVAGNTAENTPTHRAHALYDPDGNLIDQSADQLTAAWAANTAKKLALSDGVYTIPADGWYIVATTTTATTTVNTLIGCAPIVTATAAAVAGQSKSLGFTLTGSGLDGVFPASAGTLTGVAKCPLAIVSNV